MNYLLRFESQMSLLDLARVDLELSSPTLAQVLLVDGQATGNNQRVKKAVVFQIDGKSDVTLGSFGKHRIFKGVFFGQMSAHVHRVFKIGELKICRFKEDY